MSWFKNIFKKEEKETLDKGLEKSNQGFFEKMTKAVVGKTKSTTRFWTTLRKYLSLLMWELLLPSKSSRIEERIARDKYLNTSELDRILREEISGLLLENPQANTGNIDTTKKPYVIMVVGVNGVGKTTTIGKLAHQFKADGKKSGFGCRRYFPVQQL